MTIEFNAPANPEPRNGGGSDSSDETSDQPKNSGTIIFDATYTPENISYPQNVNLLNEVRENLEGMIDELCYEYGYYKPRTYRKNERKDYLNLAKYKNRKVKKIRKTIKQQLQYVHRDFGYVEWVLDEGAELSAKRRQ